jgi:p-hydroxybenzoate 3-monooxygenase
MASPRRSPAEGPSSSEEPIYARSERGFVLVSTRTAAVQRMSFQCDPADSVANWPDERIWAEFHAWLANQDGWKVREGPIFQKGIVAMRSFVCETMQHGRLFLAGDAAHIVPPTGAKGLNLAAGDVALLSRAIGEFYRNGSNDRLDAYSATAVKRVWRGEHFSWFMSTLLHDVEGEDSMTRRFRRAQLDYVVSSRAGATSLAENYVGLPFES